MELHKKIENRNNIYTYIYIYRYIYIYIYIYKRNSERECLRKILQLPVNTGLKSVQIISQREALTR